MDGETSYFIPNGVTLSPQKNNHHLIEDFESKKFEKLGLISLAAQLITGLGLTWL